VAYDEDQLNDAVCNYMKCLGYRRASLRFKGDSVWRCPDSKVIFIEHKTENESYNPNSWWTYPDNDLDGQRPYISNTYNSNDKRIWNQNKWLFAIAQLRADIKTSDNPDTQYRAAIVLPAVEISNFSVAFSRYHNDATLNRATLGADTSLKLWNQQFSYVDQRNINVQVCLIEIDKNDYFGQFWQSNEAALCRPE